MAISAEREVGGARQGRGRELHFTLCKVNKVLWHSIQQSEIK